MSRHARSSRDARSRPRLSPVRGRHARPAGMPRVAAGLACSTALATAGATVGTVAATSGTYASAATAGEAAVAYASTLTGRPYVYGASGPSSFDCSGFTMYVYAHFGVSLPHNSAAQYAAVPHVAASDKLPGDLLFFRTGGSITHVGIYAGGNDMYAAPHSGDVVKRQPIYAAYEVGRPIAAAPVPPPPPPVPAPSRDLFVTLPSATGSGMTEVHGLSRASGYQAFGTHAATALGPVRQADWRFLVAPYGGSGSPDLYAVNLRGTGSGRLEVHVLSAASGYRSFAAHIATAQPEVPAGQDVDLSLSGTAGNVQRDLYLVAKTGTGSGMVEAHVLSAASGYSTFLAHVATPVPTPRRRTWTWLAGDTGGRGDLVGVLHAGATGSGRTEVHVLSQASGYRSWSAHVATAAGLTDDARSAWTVGDADGDGATDVVLLATRGTGSGTTEVHALGGRTGYAAWTLNTGTGLGPTEAGPRQHTFG